MRSNHCPLAENDDTRKLRDVILGSSALHFTKNPGKRVAELHFKIKK